MSTEIVPAGQPAPSPAVIVTPEEPQPPRKKRRGRVIALVIVLVVVVLAVVAFFIADSVAKSYALGYVRSQVIDVLNLPDDAKVDVDLGGGSIILQALSGRISAVDVTAANAKFGELTGDVTLHAEGVPLDSTAAVKTLGINFAIDAKDLSALGSSSDPSTAPAFVFDGGVVSLSSEFNLFGATVPIGLSLEPSAVDGALVLSPTTLTIGTQTFQAGESDGSFLGQIAQVLLKPQTLCVAGSVPKALVLADAKIQKSELVLTFRGDGAALGGPELSTPGTCPAT